MTPQSFTTMKTLQKTVDSRKSFQKIVKLPDVERFQRHELFYEAKAGADEKGREKWNSPLFGPKYFNFHQTKLSSNVNFHFFSANSPPFDHFAHSPLGASVILQATAMLSIVHHCAVQISSLPFWNSNS